MTDPVDESLPPEDMLRLLQQQQDRVRTETSAPIPWLLGIWGAAWLFGFLLLWSAWPDGNPWFQVPMPIAATVFAVLMIISIVASAVLGIRIGRGVRGQSDFAGAVYGLSWSVCGAAFAAVGVGLISNGMSTELASIYFPSAYALMVGTLYLAGAALWRDKGQLVLGVVLLVLGSAAPFFGAPTNNLVMALGGGGAFLLGALVAARNLQR